MPLRALAVLALVTLAARAGAQGPSAPRAPADPRLWVSLSAGPMKFPQLNFLNTSSRENIGYGANIRGTLEIDAGKIGGFGLAVTSAELPVTYVGGAPGNSACTNGCPATLQVNSFLATLHVGGGLGFDQVYEASAGLTRFGDLDAPAEPIGIRKAAVDFTVMIGYGVAYGFTPQLSAIMVGDIGLAFHKDPSGGGVEADNYSHLIGLRAGLRYGVWNRPR